MAGFLPSWATERDGVDLTTYREKFPNAETFYFNESNFPLATAMMGNAAVLHMTAPCAYWSKTHTKRGERDEDKKNVIFQVIRWLFASKPRYIILKQVSNIQQAEKHRPYFNLLLALMGEQGYSLTWRTIDFQNYGLCSRRSRLVLIAAR
jgi:DNA (cytosine-5)-methyltransferase 1